ncbi:hypothetical protein D0T53_01830 [Dysgonomonas sp. 216]|nr:hypothetical protein [Dysgonomonas sp. 216]
MAWFMMVCYFPSGELRFGHDLYFHLLRFQALMDALREGSFPIYIDHASLNGYGYATKWFYPDVILVPFAILGNFTNIIIAYKTMLFTMTVLCGIITYVSVVKVYRSQFAAIITALLYTFCVYRLQDLSDKGALEEVLAFTFVPLIILGCFEIITRHYKRWYILAVGFSLLIFSHLLLSVMMSLIVALLVIIYLRKLIKEPIRFVYLLLATGVTVLVTVYYWLPMLEQMFSDTFYFEINRVVFSPGHGLSFRALLRALFAGFIPSSKIFSIGLGALLTISVCLRFVVWRMSDLQKSVDVGVIIGLLLILFSSSFFPIWIWPFNKLSFIQAPWRFFLIASYFFALAGGYYLSRLIRGLKYRYIAMFIVFVLTAIVIINESYGNKSRMMAVNFETVEPSLRNSFHLGGLEYISSKVPSVMFIADRGNKVISKYSKTVISDFNKNKSGVTTFEIALNGHDKLELPLLYYKGYEASVNGQLLDITESRNGLLELDVNGSGIVEVYYKGTTIQQFSYYFSILAIILLSTYILWFNRRNLLNRLKINA